MPIENGKFQTKTKKSTKFFKYRNHSSTFLNKGKFEEIVDGKYPKDLADMCREGMAVILFIISLPLAPAATTEVSMRSGW
jgi:hypothetical protein